MTAKESEIIREMKKLALDNDIHYDGKIELIILKAMRIYTAKLKVNGRCDVKGCNAQSHSIFYCERHAKMYGSTPEK